MAEGEVKGQQPLAQSIALVKCDAQPGAKQSYFERFETICEISVTK